MDHYKHWGVVKLFRSGHDYFGAQRSRMVVIKWLLGPLVLNNRYGSLHFSGDLMMHVAVSGWIDAELLSKVNGLHSRLLWSTLGKVTASHLLLFEIELHITCPSSSCPSSEVIFRQMVVSDFSRFIPIHPWKHILKDSALGARNEQGW